MDESLDRIHIPVMRTEILEVFRPVLADQESIYVDCTLGIGGHAQAILSTFENAKVIGIDRDPHALALAAARLADFKDRVRFVRGVFADLDEIVDEPVQAILADLGLSSLQIDAAARGFSYATPAPLDMRMDPDTELTAAVIVNEYPETDLARIFREYGEERFAIRVAKAIGRIRLDREISSSAQLAEIIASAIPKATQGHGHPAKRCFQALRIEVNQELALLDQLLPKGLAALSHGGRFAVLSYHSLEDRRVKQVFRAASTDQAPKSLPFVPPQLKAQYHLVTKGAERPKNDECANNPRAASARLRVIERKTP